MIDEKTSTSVFDSTQELRIIRSHRAPRRSRRWVVVALSVCMAVTGLTAVNRSAPVEAEVIASPIQVETQIESRGMEVTTRSQRAALTRSQKIEKVIAYAMAQRGDRYSWGAAGPNRWDCSGLVSTAFRKGAGKALPHFTGGIQKKGVKVAKKNLKRGDIIFPQRGHVGIYLGGGKMIHASSGKGKVVVAKVYGFYTARRII